jgi:predicted ester cyclase
VFHGPDGRTWNYEALKGCFAALRAAFHNLTITRGIIVAEENHVACQTTISGTFARDVTHSPVGPLLANGQRVDFELMNIFRYDEEGKLAEEWIQTDARSTLRQLGGADR